MSPSAALANTHTRAIPRFLVAMGHPTTRRYVCDLVEQHCRCWIATASPEPALLAAALDDLRPDALIIEAATLNDAAAALTDQVTHIVVIGPQPDTAYRDLALEAGADAWVARDRVATDLVAVLDHIRCDPMCQCGCHDHPKQQEVNP